MEKRLINKYQIRGVLDSQLSPGKASSDQILANAILWTFIVIDYTLIHIFNVYITPNCKTKEDSTILNLKQAIETLITRKPNARIIVCGDFNKRRRDIENFRTSKHIFLIVKDGKKSHIKENHLDQVSSNVNYS